MYMLVNYVHYIHLVRSYFLFKTRWHLVASS